MRVPAVVLLLLMAQQAPVFRAGVDYVRVDVVVTDKNDVPVTDLTKADFELTDRGRPQTITDFEFVSVPVQTRTVDLKAPRPPEPDVATNIPASPDSRLFVMLIDDLHILEKDIVAVKKAMTEFLAALSPDDEVAIAFVGRSDLGQNYTRDVGRLLRAVDKVRDALGFGLEPGYGLQSLAHARSFAFTLKSVTASLAGSGHSRRAIVLVSNGTSIDPMADPTSGEYLAAMHVRDELNEAYELAHRADVPIYPLDPRGLIAPEDAIRGAPFLSYQARAEIARRIRIQNDRLAEIAINTGGRAFTKQSDLTRAVREIVRDNGSYYVLGFYPNPLDRDGKFHGIDVKVKRPGLRVRARYGYVAPAATAESAETKPVLDKAMSAGVNVSGLSLRAHVAPLAASPKGMTSAVTIEVTYPVPSDGSRRISDDLRISVLALDTDGKVKARVEQNRHFSGLAPEGLAAVTFLIDDAVELPAQPLTIRIGVASQALGKAGTVQLPVDVPKPSDGRLQMTGLVLTLDDPPKIGVMGGDLIADLVPFQPMLGRSFTSADAIRVFARVFWESRDTNVTATVTILGPRAPAGQSLTLSGGTVSGNRREATLDATVPLTALAPGAYVLRVETKLANGQSATREVPFQVR
jgi:VWFA-related protein